MTSKPTIYQIAGFIPLHNKKDNTIVKAEFHFHFEDETKVKHKHHIFQHITAPSKIKFVKVVIPLLGKEYDTVKHYGGKPYKRQDDNENVFDFLKLLPPLQNALMDQVNHRFILDIAKEGIELKIPHPGGRYHFQHERVITAPPAAAPASTPSDPAAAPPPAPASTTPAPAPVKSQYSAHAALLHYTLRRIEAAMDGL